MQPADDPERLFVAWFVALPLWQRQALAYCYFLMTSNRSDDFAMDGAESLQRFHLLLGSPDFPIRRITRLLSVRGVFGFLYSNFDFARQFVLDRITDANGKTVSLGEHQWSRGATRWKRLCSQGLSDEALHAWLTRL